MEGNNKEEIKLFCLHQHKILFSYALREGNDFKISKIYELKQKNNEIGNFKNNTYMFIKCTECNEDLYSKNRNNIMLFRTKNNKEWITNKFNDNWVLNQVISSSNPKLNLYNLYSLNYFDRDKFYKIQKDSENDEYVYIGTLSEINQYFKTKLEELKLNFSKLKLADTNLKKENSELKKEVSEFKKKLSVLQTNYSELSKSHSDLKTVLGVEDKNIEQAYDIVLSIKSMEGLKNGGWNIKYPKGKEEYITKMKKKAIIVGVIGNGNKGKSFILGKLSEYEVPQGFTINTEGLSIRYGDRDDHCVAILDSAGQETPLLNDEIVKLISINQSVNKDEKESIEIEGKLRDKLITEAFIQQFIIEISDILILVVGAITLNEQKLLERVRKLLTRDKHLYVIHNLQNYSSKNQVEGYITDTLLKLFGLKLNEINFQYNLNDVHKFYYVEEKNKKITHLIFVNAYCQEIADYYNRPALMFLQDILKVEKNRTEFSVIEYCKNFLLKIQSDFLENPIGENDFCTETEDKIILKKDVKDIKLKRVFVDEIGTTVTNYADDIKYYYYINDDEKDKKVFNICLENPGRGTDIEGKEIERPGEFYTFEFTAIKPGLNENNLNKMIKKNIPKESKVRTSIHLPAKDIYLLPNDDGDLNFFEKSKADGIFTFKYKILQKKNKNNND